MIKYFLIFIYILFSFQNFLFSQDSTEKRKIQLKGIVKNMDGKVKNTTIRIVYENGEVDSVFCKKGKYDLYIKVNRKILIEFITKDNYIKRIAFNTEISKSQKSIPFFDLTINLVEKGIWNIKEEDEDVLDMPVAYLKYSTKRKVWYDQNAKYTRIINKKIKSLGVF